MIPFTIRGIQAFCYRYPLTTPVVTSFGEMRDRPALFIRAEDDDGQTGWGEVWCNFPSVGAEHRTRLGAPADYGRLAADMLENGYLNGQTIRLDGAIRMAPR